MFQNENESREVAITSEGGRFFITAPWEKVENLRDYLAREGISTTQHLEPATHTARLEAWEGTDEQQLRKLIAEWEPRRIVAAL